MKYLSLSILIISMVSCTSLSADRTIERNRIISPHFHFSSDLSALCFKDMEFHCNNIYIGKGKEGFYAMVDLIESLPDESTVTFTMKMLWYSDCESVESKLFTELIIRKKIRVQLDFPEKT